MDELAALRQEIDRIDKALAPLFLERMELAQRVGEYKRRNGLQVLDATREAVVLESKRALASTESEGRELVALFETIMGISRARQARVVPSQAPAPLHLAQARVIFQGEAGAYTEAAALQYFGKEVDITPTPRWVDVFDALAAQTADFGVLPIENSTTGAITQVYDLLAQRNCSIVGEVILPVHHCLMGQPDAQIEALTEVFSHPQGFYQCTQFLADKSFRCTQMGNTALAAQHVAKLASPSVAAIGSPYAAQVYGLSVLAEGINDAQFNQTRFLVIAAQARASADADKLSLLFTLPHRSGTLNEVMQIFARHGLNLLKLESRPLPERPWEYSFFVDIEGNLDTEDMRAALEDLRVTALHLQILGNYKSA